MHVREAMTEIAVSVGPQHSLQEAASLMARHNVGSAVVHDPESPGPGIITERDILKSLGQGQDPSEEMIANHLTSRLVYASPEWSLEQAACAMVRGNFRHLIVIEEGEVVGMLSNRDILSRWTEDGASCEFVPATLNG